MIPSLLNVFRNVPPSGWEEGLLNEIWRNLIQHDRYLMLLDGLVLTLQIAIFSVLMGTVLGFVLSLMKISNLKIGTEKRCFSPLRAFSTLYISVIRGIPLLVQLMLMRFVILPNDMPILWVCTITFGINSSAYVAEIFRAGILSVDKGQTEAGRSLGLSSVKTMLLIIFPQAIKNALPSLGNEFIILFKDTSIVGFIGAQDLTQIATFIRSRTFSPFVPLIFIAIVYLIFVLTMTWLLGRLERRLRKSDSR